MFINTHSTEMCLIENQTTVCQVIQSRVTLILFQDQFVTSVLCPLLMPVLKVQISCHEDKAGKG